MMRTNRIRTAVVTLTAAGLLAAGTMAYADDDTTIVAGGNGGKAVSGLNDASYNNATSGNATGSSAEGGNANNYQNSGDGGEYGPSCSSESYKTFGLLAAVQGVNVCPNVGPVASSMEGGDATGGDNETGDVDQDNNASSTASANGGDAGTGYEKSTPTKSKKAKKRSHRHGRRHH